MTYAFGGAGSYVGRGLAEAHAHLIRDKGLKPEHFDMVAGHLVATLQGLGIAKVSRWRGWCVCVCVCVSGVCVCGGGRSCLQRESPRRSLSGH